MLGIILSTLYMLSCSLPSFLWGISVIPIFKKQIEDPVK